MAQEALMDTTTSYLGFRLPHPFMAGASPFGHTLDNVKRLEDAGCAAVVLHSLFEEQITLAHEGRVAHVDAGDEEFAEVVERFPKPGDYPYSPDAYADHIVSLKQAIRIPIIGSLNGTAAQSWLRFAEVIEQAGADALELNLYDVVTDLQVPATSIERQSAHIVRELKRILRIPVAVKLSPFYTAFGNMAAQLDQAGADALVLFNRFYQPDIDIQTGDAVPRIELSRSDELLLRLRWVAILHGRVRPALAVTGGVSTPNDGIKAILAGADVVQLVSALLRHGPTHIVSMRQALERWMEWNHVERLDEMRGRSSLRRTRDPAAFERANYIRALQTWGRTNLEHAPRPARVSR
jgi:dihydroorotate dehydrogenase (fumarate)